MVSFQPVRRVAILQLGAGHVAGRRGPSARRHRQRAPGLVSAARAGEGPGTRSGRSFAPPVAGEWRRSRHERLSRVSVRVRYLSGSTPPNSVSSPSAWRCGRGHVSAEVGGPASDRSSGATARPGRTGRGTHGAAEWLDATQEVVSGRAWAGRCRTGGDIVSDVDVLASVLTKDQALVSL